MKSRLFLLKEVFRFIFVFIIVLINVSPAGAQALITPRTVTIWYAYNQGGAEEQAFMQVIQNAEAAYPGLDIVPEFHPFGSLFTDYETAVQAGNGPDMYVAPNDSLGDYARKGVILNIDAYLQGQLGNFSQVAIDGMKVDGSLYGIPESAKALALYYNKSLISTPPTTTAELLASSKVERHSSLPASAVVTTSMAFGQPLVVRFSIQADIVLPIKEAWLMPCNTCLAFNLMEQLFRLIMAQRPMPS